MFKDLYFDIMLDHHLSQKFKLIKNYLINILLINGINTS